MDHSTMTTRVESFVNELQKADWQQQIGGWTLTLVAVTVVWWFLRRVRFTANAVRGEREMPAVIPDAVSVLLIPLDLGLVAIFAFWGYLCALTVWRLIGRRYRVDSFSRRLASFFAVGSVGLTALLFVLGVGMQIAEGNPPAAVVTDGVDEIGGWLPEWLIYLPVPAVATSLAASWRRGEFELTARRRQTLAVAAVAIIVAPGVLGAAGVGGAVDDGGAPDIEPRTESSEVVDQMDDGLAGPTKPELNDSALSKGEFHEPTALLACGDVNQSVYRLDTYMDPEYPAAATVNISEPSDSSQEYIELAPYRDDGEIVHGRYAFRVTGDEWTLLETWYGNPEYDGGDHWNATAGAYHTYDESSGIIAMENTEAATIGFDLVNEDGEVIRVQYRLCRPDGET